MIYPLKEWVAARRGYRFGQKTFYTGHHLGVDHIVPEGTPIYAPINCEIIFSQVGDQGGNTIWASFQDKQLGLLIIRCMHLRALTPKGRYNEGDVIGYTGNTGSASTGPHLHTDISKGKVGIKNFNNFIDPEKYFSDMVNNQNKNMQTYKKDGESTIYILVGDILIPFATSFEIYQKEFGGAELIKLSAEEFSKYKVSGTVQITSK